MLGFDGKYPVVHPKAIFWCFLAENCKKLAVKHSVEKPIPLNFVNLSPSFCPRLYYAAKYYVLLTVNGKMVVLWIITEIWKEILFVWLVYLNGYKYGYKCPNGYKCPDSSEQDHILEILDKYKDHPSIKLIKAKNNSSF